MSVPSPQATPGAPGQQHWVPGTPGAPQGQVVGAPVQTVQTAGIQTPGVPMVQGAPLSQDEAQRQLLFQRQQQLRRLQLLQQQKQAQLQAQQAGQVVQGQVQGQVVQGQVVQGQVVQGQVGPGQVVQGPSPRMNMPFPPTGPGPVQQQVCFYFH